MSPDLERYEPSKEDCGKHCWNLGWFEIGQAEARRILNAPHYEELDSYRTAGGTEDHWTFLCNGKQPVFFKLAVPYERLHVHVAAAAIPDGAWDIFVQLFPTAKFERLDCPFNEMAHLTDPAFYYQGIAPDW